MEKPEKVKLPVQRFEAFFVAPPKKQKPEQVPLAEGDSPADEPDPDDEDRSCDMTWYTGATVQRYGWDGPYNLRLSMDPAHVRMSRLSSGRAPLLNTHSSYTLADVIGVVESATVENGVGKASVRFSNRPDVDGIWQDVQDGIVCNASVGAKIFMLRDVSEPNDKIKSMLAIDWEPQEISAVPVGADAGASFAEEKGEVECLIEWATAQGEKKMEDTTQLGAPAVAATPDVNAIRTAALAEERTRTAGIKAALKAAGLSSDEQFAASLIDGDVTIDSAREKILAKLAERSDAHTTDGGVTILADAADKRRDGLENALLNRYDPGKFKLEAGREYRSMTLMEMAKDACLSAGKNPRSMAISDIAKFALQGTTDFPNVLANVANKTLRTAYDAEPQTFKPFSRMTTATDFKPLNRVQLGDSQTLETVGASGEFKYGSMPDAKETYQLATYGKIVAVNRQTIINDDLDAFTRIPASQGRAAARLESDTVWGIVTANAAMGDGTALFHANHGNLTASGTVISVTSLGVGRKSLRVQTGLNGIGYLNLAPKYLIVPTALETVAQQFTVQTQIIYTKAADTNPFAGSLVVIPEPRLDVNSATAWYLCAEPSAIDTIEYAYLSGQEGVYLETRMGFDVDGMELKARLDFAAKAIDWRGLYKNVGV